MLNQHIALAIFWIIFSIFHTVFALTKWKLLMQNLMQKNYKYYRLLYSCFAATTLILVVYYNFLIESKPLWRVSLTEIILSVVCFTISFFMMMMFTKKFFFELSGAAILTKTKRSDTLINTGFYKYVRHPLYTATLLLIWSLFFLQPQLSNLISCVCITAYTLTGIIFEEKKLVQHFGESYIQYRKNTPMLVPKLINN